jgi:hypothetical protein
MRIARIVKLVVPSMVLGACATGGASIDRGSSPIESLGHASGAASVDSSLTGDRLAAASNLQLPTADLQFHRIWDEAGDTASADIRLCIAPDGHVTSVGLVRGSSSTTYNQALVNDAADWRFDNPTTPPSPMHCEVATVVYLPHA